MRGCKRGVKGVECERGVRGVNGVRGCSKGKRGAKDECISYIGSCHLR